MASLFTKTISLKKEFTIEPEEFSQLRDFIYAQSGIYIADNRKYLLENRLRNRLKQLNLKSFGEYYYYLQYDAGRKQELNKLFEVVTTNETSFFRNPPQLKVFQDHVLKEVVEAQRKAGDRRVRIWSAGCSTGEEPYTVAMQAMEVLGSELPVWDVKITANDLSEAVLASARRGVYNEYALRTTPKEAITRYFEPEDGAFKVRQEAMRLVSFGQINLSDRAQLKRVERSHVVFAATSSSTSTTR
jgi:chemotaxis protein methyltransferase CheR